MTPTPDITKQQIITLLQANQPAEARRLCLKFVQGSADLQGLVLLADAEIRLNNFDAAVSSLRKAIKNGWNDPGGLVMLTALLITQGKRKSADSFFAKLGKRVPGPGAAHLHVAKALRQLGNRAAAGEHYRQTLNLDPKNFSACFEFAAFLQEGGSPEEAIQWYERCRTLHPDNTQVLTNLAICLGSTKRFDDAAGVLEQAAKLDPADAAVCFYMGENYQQQNRYKLAVASYRRALELTPDSSALHGSLARAQRNLGDLEAATKSLQRAQALEPQNATVHNDLGICLYRDDNLEPALSAFSTAVRLNPDNALPRFYLGIVHAQCGDQSASEEQFSQACRLWPYMESFVDSYRYARQAGPDARYFCTGRQMFEYAMDNANDSGLFMEFGVYFGTSINIIARLTNQAVHGFDTFQGLPIDWVVDREVEGAGSYSTHGALPEAPENVQYHVGTFEETLPGFCKAHQEQISFMNIDCDLYESTRTIFDFLGDRVRPGTVIVFDEYFCLADWREHEYKAFQEFISGSGLGYEYLAFNFFTGQAVVRVTASP